MEWIPALITGGLAMATAIAVGVLNIHDRGADRTAAHKAQERLAVLENRLQEDSATAAAIRAYENEALKRLYTVARPLLFQLGELCETSNRRIDKILAGVIRLRPGSSALVTTTYRLIAPLVLIRLLQQRLTTVDLGLDKSLRNEYLVARELLSVLNNGYELSKLGRPFEYRVDRPDGPKEPRQHLTVRYLNNVIEAMTKRNSDGNMTGLKSALEFEAQCTDPESPVAGQCAGMFELLKKAVPSSAVLWRILATHRALQAELLRLLAQEGYPQSTSVFPPPGIEPFKTAYSDSQDAAKEYVGIRLPRGWATIGSPEP